MIIRPLLSGDVPALARLMAGDPLWQRYGVTEEAAARRLREGFAAGATIAVAEIDGEPVGFVWYVARGAFNRSGYIMLIGVQGDARGTGVGRALMEQAEGALFAHSADVFLLVSDFNQAAQAFYGRLGYEQVGMIPDYVVPGVAELVFRKRKRQDKLAAVSPLRSGPGFPVSQSTGDMRLQPKP
jgi:[ribosomal protein S18]-alanine N-acetyltransferase